MSKLKIHHLRLSWGVSRGRDTEGYTICRLDDSLSGKRYRCMGGGYDMVGTCFGDWLADNYQTELLKIKERAHYRFGTWEPQKDSFYGMSYNAQKNKVSLDGACGLDCMFKIANAIGLEVQREYKTNSMSRGETLGWFVSQEIGE